MGVPLGERVPIPSKVRGILEPSCDFEKHSILINNSLRFEFYDNEV